MRDEYMPSFRTYRVYFNRCEDAPQVWSVDEGDISSEINVLGIVVAHPDIEVSWVYDPDVPTGPHEPRAWNVIRCREMHIEFGVARFS